MPENQNVEYKESWRDEYLKWIASFANAQGGTLYIGINDQGDAVGVPDIQKLMEDIPNRVRDTMGILVEVDALKRDGKDVLAITVQPSSYPVSFHGKFHVRVGSTKQELTGAALTDFLVQKTGFKWDAVPVDALSIDELDAESLKIFRREAIRAERLSKEDANLPDAELLEKLGLLVDGKLKRAAVLLFYSNPQRFITGSYVKIGKFGEGPDLQYQDTLENGLILAAVRVINLIFVKYLKAAITYDKDVRVETYPFARDAVREAIYNALIHNKWESGIPIQIRIQDDCMLISNDCVLPPGWTTENLLKSHRSMPYNPDIANAFYRAGYIESWGRGIQKIKDACARIGALPPEYTISGGALTVKLTAIATRLNPEITDDANYEANDANREANSDANGANHETNQASDLRHRILRVMMENPSITTNAMENILGVSRSTIQREIKVMKDEKIIRRSGNRRSGTWEVIE